MATGGRRNHWVADKNALVTWQAELTHLREEPEALARWLRAIVRAGEDNEVYVVQEAPYLGYRRREHGEFLPFLESYMEREGVIDPSTPSPPASIPPGGSSGPLPGSATTTAREPWSRGISTTSARCSPSSGPRTSCSRVRR